MQTIYKYPLKAADRQYLILPKHSQILSVANQREIPVLYAIVNPETKETEDYMVYIYGTGVQLDPDPGEFLGTVLMCNGSLVWHVFYTKLDYV